MPRYGFNFQWMFSKDTPDRKPVGPDLKALDFLAKHGFNFVRIPADYRFWTADFEYFMHDERVFELFDASIAACAERGIQTCLNLHRAPGYCINQNELEKHSLWKDDEAQEAFVYLWETLAGRFKRYPNSNVSFDLLNEPPQEGWDWAAGFTREAHDKLMRRTVDAIRAVDPEREIVLDGLAAGNAPMPELADLNVIQSCRGYQPMELTHYEAPWAKTWLGNLSLPTWPLQTKAGLWNLEKLREFYAPWRALEQKGVRVHVGEFGCFNRTPNAAALAWFKDLLGLYKEFGWGYALWGFDDSFGIGNHGRPGVKYETLDGYSVDRELLDLLLGARNS